MFSGSSWRYNQSVVTTSPYKLKLDTNVIYAVPGEKEKICVTQFDQFFHKMDDFFGVSRCNSKVKIQESS